MARIKDNYFLASFVMTFITFSFLLNGFQYFILAVHSSQESENNCIIKSMNYTFTWGPETQDIVDGILTMEVSVWIENRTNPPPWDNTTTTLFYIVIKINDDDFGSNDYLGLVLDKNRNGVIDFGYGDHPQILYANNSTLLYSASLDPLGSLVPPEVPRVYMITCTYNPQEGYTFKSFGEPTHGPAYRLLEFTSTVGESSYLPIYLCFLDANSRFRFNLVSIEFRVYLD